MKIHEYQAAKLMSDYGIPACSGTVADSASEVRRIAEEMGGSCVIKAQIHSGGRGKAGGVKVAHTPEEAESAAMKMLGSKLVTKQTGPEGKIVHKVFVTAPVKVKKEYYFSVTMDNDAAGLVMIASSAGGMEIEDTAANDPDAIIRMPVSLTLGYQDYLGRELARRLGLPKELWKEFISLAGNVVNLFIQKDCSLVEINPLVETDEGHLLALDAKITFDDNALYRHKDCAELFDPLEEDPKEAQAKKFDLSYISLNGDVGCLVNGAGLAMATMDVIIKFGGMPANFLDVGGSASKEKVKAAFEILLADGNVHAIFVNIFGGIMKCDVIAEGVVAAARDIDIKVPLIVRLEGTNVDRGKQILRDSGLNIIAASDMADGARKAVSSAAEFAKEAGK